MTNEEATESRSLHERLKNIARSGGSSHNGDHAEHVRFETAREEAAYWRGRFEQGRERLAKLWIAYKDLEAERDLWKEKAIEAHQDIQPKGAVVEEPRTATERAVDALESETEGTGERVEERLESASATEPGPRAAPGEDATDDASDARGGPTATESKIPEGLLPERVQAILDDPFGDIHPVRDVEGIGDVYSDRLEDAGLFDTRRLWYADPETAAETADVGEQQLRRWQAQSELMALNGVGPQYAELLVRSGITTLDELAKQDADELVDRVESKQESLDVSIQGNPPTKARASRWINRAQTHPN